MKKKKALLIIPFALTALSLSGCTQLNTSTKKRLKHHPECVTKYHKHHFTFLERTVTDINILTNKCIDLNQEKTILRKYPACATEFNESHEAGVACSIKIKREREEEKEKARQEELEKKEKARREYLASPAGQKRLKKHQERQRNLIPTCNNLAIDISKKYSVGKYIETLGAHFISEDVGICFVKYIKTSVYGYDSPNIIKVTFNFESGNYKISRNN